MVPGAATVIIMVCVGFLVVMVILGVFRIRSIHRRGEGARGGAKEGSGQWDDSALTIIVNPMEVRICVWVRGDTSEILEAKLGSWFLGQNLVLLHEKKGAHLVSRHVLSIPPSEGLF